MSPAVPTNIVGQSKTEKNFFYWLSHKSLLHLVLGGSLRQCWFFSGNQIGYIYRTGSSHFLKPSPPEPNQQILIFWYPPPESNQKIIFLCYPPPELTQKKSLKIKEPGKNQERTIGFFLKTVGSLRVLKYPELTGTLILILKNYPEPASSLILVF
jgi:hypothetical protein